MKKIDVKIINETGIHARPASILSKEAARFSANINFVREEKKFSAKSIISILSMGLKKDETISIEANGNDEVEALEAIGLLFANNFGE